MTASKKSATPKKTAAAVKPVVRATPKPAAKTVGKPAAKAAVKPFAKAAVTPVPAPKPAAKPTETMAAKTVKPTKVEKADKVEKPKKPKLVRDSFTIPKAEYLVLEELKQRSARLAHPVKKSELLRAGIKALAALADAGFLAAVQAVPAIKTGRPKAAPQKPAA